MAQKVKLFPSLVVKKPVYDQGLSLNLGEWREIDVLEFDLKPGIARTLAKAQHQMGAGIQFSIVLENQERVDAEILGSVSHFN